jgi:hypothetical protein
MSGALSQGAVRSTLDSIEEFRVTTAGDNADQGRSSGGQVALVTKSGTNTFHGSLYEQHRPTITAANDWFNKHAQLNNGQANTPSKIIRNTFGGALGGTIWKDRLFFFGTYEQRPNHSIHHRPLLRHPNQAPSNGVRPPLPILIRKPKVTRPLSEPRS